MDPAGDGTMGIAVVAEAPGKEEDKLALPLVGRAGQFLRKHMAKVGLELDADCLKLNVVQCRPPDNRNPTPDELACCRVRVTKQLEYFAPDLIFAFGTPAIQEICRDAPFSPNATNMHGRIVPSHLWGCPVVCGFHPSFYLHERGKSKTGKFDGRMTELIRLGLRTLTETPVMEDRRLDPDAFDVVEDLGDVEKLFRRLDDDGGPVAFDYETNALEPFRPESKFLCASLTNTPDHGWVIPLEHRQARWSTEDLRAVYERLSNWLGGPTPKVIQNWQFEEVWSIVKLGVPIRNVVADTMVREHVLDNRVGVTRQSFQEYVRYGEAGHKGSVDRAALNYEFLEMVARYGALDVRYGLQIYRDQTREIREACGR